MPPPDMPFSIEQELDFASISKMKFRVAIALSAVMIVMYFTFMAMFAFAKPTMGMLLTSGLSLCILLGASVIIGSFLLCLVYVVWANRIYDPAVSRILDRGASNASR